MTTMPFDQATQQGGVEPDTQTKAEQFVEKLLQPLGSGEGREITFEACREALNDAYIRLQKINNQIDANVKQGINGDVTIVEQKVAIENEVERLIPQLKDFLLALPNSAQVTQDVLRRDLDVFNEYTRQQQIARHYKNPQELDLAKKAIDELRGEYYAAHGRRSKFNHELLKLKIPLSSAEKLYELIAEEKIDEGPAPAPVSQGVVLDDGVANNIAQILHSAISGQKVDATNSADVSVQDASLDLGPDNSRANGVQPVAWVQSDANGGEYAYENRELERVRVIRSTPAQVVVNPSGRAGSEVVMQMSSHTIPLESSDVSSVKKTNNFETTMQQVDSRVSGDGNLNETATKLQDDSAEQVFDRKLYGLDVDVSGVKNPFGLNEKNRTMQQDQDLLARGSETGDTSIVEQVEAQGNVAVSEVKEPVKTEPALTPEEAEKNESARKSDELNRTFAEAKARAEQAAKQIEENLKANKELEAGIKASIGTWEKQHNAEVKLVPEDLFKNKEPNIAANQQPNVDWEGLMASKGKQAAVIASFGGIPVKAPETAPLKSTDSAEEVSTQEGPTVEPVITLERAGSAVVSTEADPVLAEAEEVLRVAVEGAKKVDDQEKISALLERFDKEFGLSIDDLKSIEGFDELSQAQQRLVFENHAQITLGRIEQGARAEYEEQRANTTVAGSRLLGKVWAGIKGSFYKKGAILEEEKKIDQEFKRGGLAVHGEILSKLVSEMRVGPAVIERPDGTISVAYVEAKEGATEKEKEYADQFNDQAFELAKIPFQWGFPTATKAQQKAFNDATEKYESARDRLLNQRDADGYTLEQNYLFMAQAEKNISANRMIQTNPDAVNVLANIQDKNVWAESLKTVVAERGYYAVGGFVARSVSMGVLGVLAAPVVAAASGSILGWTRSGAELRERDRDAREGIQDKSKQALNIIDAKSAIKKIDLLISRLDDIDDKINLLKNGVAVVGSSAEVVHPDNLEKLQVVREKLLTSLEERASYTQDKISLGKMNLGKKDEQAANIYAVAEKIAQAKIRFAEASGNKSLLQRLELSSEENLPRDAEGNDMSLHGRLERQLERNEKNILVSRRRFQLSRAALGGVGATLASVAGMAIRDAIAGKNPIESLSADFQKATQRVSDVFSGTKPTTVVEQLPTDSQVASPAVSTEQIVTPPGQAEVASGVSEAVRHEALTAYVVGERETFWGASIKNIPAIRDLGKGKIQDNVMANFLKSLSKEELESIGIKNGDPGKIQVGQTLNFARAAELFEQKTVSGRKLIDHALRLFGSSEPIDKTIVAPPVNEVTGTVQVPTDAVIPTPRVAPLQPSEVISSASVREAQNIIEQGQKIDAVVENMTNTLFSKEKDLWNVLSGANLYEFMRNGQSFAKTPEQGTVIAQFRQAIEEAMQSGTKGEDNDTIEMFIYRYVKNMYQANPQLQKLSLQQLKEVLEKK